MERKCSFGAPFKIEFLGGSVRNCMVQKGRDYRAKASRILNRFKCASTRSLLVRMVQTRNMYKTHPLLNPSRTFQMTINSPSVSTSFATTVL